MTTNHIVEAVALLSLFFVCVGSGELRRQGVPREVVSHGSEVSVGFSRLCCHRYRIRPALLPVEVGLAAVSTGTDPAWTGTPETQARGTCAVLWTIFGKEGGLVVEQLVDETIQEGDLPYMR